MKKCIENIITFVKTMVLQYKSELTAFQHTKRVVREKTAFCFFDFFFSCSD